MNAILSSHGRFHAFRMAEQLEKHKVLKVLYTQDLLKEQDNLSSSKVKGRKILRLLRYIDVLFMFLPWLSALEVRWFSFKRKAHDRYVKKSLSKLTGYDPFVGMHGCCLESIRQAKAAGAVTIVEHGGNFPLHREQVLENAARDLKAKFKKTYNRDYLQEFEEADHITVLSEYSKRTFVENGYSKDKIKVVPLGVDLSLFKPQEKKDEVFRIIYVGRLCVAKGVHLLLEAFHEVHLKNSELLLIGAMQKDIEPFIRKHAGGGYEKGVRIVRPKKQSELHKYYSSGSVFVFPSLDDGFGMVVLEAMACGIPIIATENSGAGSLIDGNGYIITANDKEAIKEKIIKLYNEPDLCRKMSKVSIAIAKKNTWDDYGKKLIELYEGLLREKRK